MDQGLRELISSVEALDYLPRRVFLSRVVNPPYPRFLYKFREVDPGSEDSRIALRGLLVESNLWLSSVEALNDPFDMAARYIASGTPSEKEVALRRIIASGVPDSRQHQAYLEKLRHTPLDEMERIARQSHEVARKTIGVCSLAGDPRNIQMWSHYSRDHTGICLQFEVTRDFKTFHRAIPVEYSNVYPKVNWISRTNEEVAATLLRKEQRWNYERERRIIDLRGANTTLPFLPEALTGLVFGCRFDTDHGAYIKGLLEERAARGSPPVRLYAATLHGSEYRLVLRRRAA